MLLLGSAVPSSSLTPTASAQTPLKVRMSVLPIFISAPMLIAQEKGYFAQAGIDLETTPLWVSSDLIAAFASNEIDGAAAGFGPAQMNAVNQGFDFKMIAPLHSEAAPRDPAGGAEGALGRRHGPLGGRLEGRNVGASTRRARPSSTGSMPRSRSGGLTPNDVDVVVLPFPDAIVAMANGALDAP